MASSRSVVQIVVVGVAAVAAIGAASAAGVVVVGIVVAPGPLPLESEWMSAVAWFRSHFGCRIPFGWPTH